MPQVGTNGNDPETYFNNMDPVIYGLDGDDFIRWTVIPTVTGTAVVNAYIDGGRGNDTLFGGIGDDIIYGGDGNDLVRGEGGIDVVYGGDGNDVVHIRSGGGGRGEGGTRLAQPSTVFGGRGDDLIYSVGRNRLFGDDGNDTIHADISGAFIDGGTGNDIIFAGGSEGQSPGFSTTAYGGDGDDIIYGMNADYLYGGNGSDSYEITASRTYISETATVASDRSTDKVFAYIDFTLPEHVEVLVMIYGQQTYGYGNDEANVIIGNASNNVLEGKRGYDTLTGGAGSDLFVIHPNWGVDVITDFTAGAGTPDAVIFSRSVFSSYEQVIASARQVGADTWIGDGALNTVVLQNVTLASLHQNDFGFI